MSHAALDSETRPLLNRATDAKYQFNGLVREYIDAVIHQWVLKMPEENPAVLDMLREPDARPYRSLLPWSGEFAGKYLTGAVQLHRLTHDPELRGYIAKYVADLVALQSEDGYLGAFPVLNRLAPGLPPVETRTWEGVDWGIDWKCTPWDVWGHYHAMLGLIFWYEDTHDQKALRCVTKIADLMCQRFLDSGHSIAALDCAEMNLAIIHSLSLLHRITKTETYLALARRIADHEFAEEKAGDYLRVALAGKEFYEGPKPRWESLHPIQGLAELYWLTGEKRYRTAYEQIWWSIVQFDRHNNGGFSSGEIASGNPYDQGAIETCCTVAWIALSIDMLRLSGNSIVADELELSTLNQVLGYQDRSGDWCTYNTPMDGVRMNSPRVLAFQKRPGCDEVNCCSANAPRGFGMISEWALMSEGRDLVVNWYGPSIMTASMEGHPVKLVQETEYPRGGRVTMHLSLESELAFILKLRIPHWSATSVVSINGEPIPEVRPGRYLELTRTWKDGDTIALDFDMSLHYWVGERELAGKVSTYRGPLLLAREQTAPRATYSPEWNCDHIQWSTRKPGASMEYRFEGTELIWEGHYADDAGLALIEIDGREVARVDQYGAERVHNFRWEYRNLKPGSHRVKLTLLAERNPASRDNWINMRHFGPPLAEEPVFDATALAEKLGPVDPTSFVQLAVKTVDGQNDLWRDYGTVGENLKPYTSWLRISGVKPEPFSRENPLRSSRRVE